MRIATLFAALGLAWAVVAVSASRPQAAPAQSAAHEMPHDQHGGMTVSAVPYSDVHRAKEAFGKANPIPAGILPVDVFLHNDTDLPIHVDLQTIQLDVHYGNGRQQYIDWLALADAARLIAHPKGPSNPSARRFPIGIPLPGSDNKADKMAELLRPLVLDSDIVPPKATIHGFLLFDLDRDFSLVGDASLYVPDVEFIPSKKPMIFFEVPFGNSAQQ